MELKLYEQAVMGDLIYAVRDFLDANIVIFDEETRKFKYLNPVAYSMDGPWIMQRPAPDRLCPKWSSIYWRKYKFLPQGCRGCWKIACKIDTLEQLYKLYELQQELDLPSKCGLDRRDWTPTIYSGFWYCPMEQGLEGARVLWKKINKLVHKKVDPNVKVVLKRACTEMEAGIGPSDEWPKMTERELDFERLLESVWPDPPPQTPTPTLLRMHLFTKWVRWAWAHGDPTWHKFTTKPLMRPLVEYQTSIHSPSDFPVPLFDHPIIGAKDEKRTEDPSSFKMDESEREPEQGIALVS